jgi:hypothetical protein
MEARIEGNWRENISGWYVRFVFGSQFLKCWFACQTRRTKLEFFLEKGLWLKIALQLLILHVHLLQTRLTR